MKEKRSSIEIFLGVLVAVVVFSAGGGSCGDVDFLVPGVSFETLSFDTGARVDYLIVSHAFGTEDTSLVGLAVLEADETDVILEILSAPWPVVEEEAVTVRLKLDRDVTSVSENSNFRDYLKGVQVRDGTGPFRVPSEDEIENFDLEKIFISKRSGFQLEGLDPEEIETPAGRFTCEVRELSSSVKRTVNLGGIDAVRIEEEWSAVWRSSEVPFWGVVRSRVERIRKTELQDGSLLDDASATKTVTESILYSYSK